MRQLGDVWWVTCGRLMVHDGRRLMAACPRSVDEGAAAGVCPPAVEEEMDLSEIMGEEVELPRGREEL